MPHDRAEAPVITVRSWDADTLDEHVVSDVDELQRPDPAGRTWVDVVGLSDTKSMASIGERFGLHVLSLEDVLDPDQRPKAERHETHTFVVLQAATLGPEAQTHPIGLFFGEGFVVTFHPPGLDCLEPVRHRLQQARSGLRRRGIDYLAYAIIDSTVDHYFPVLDELDERVAALEDEVLESRTADPIERVHVVRRDLRAIRRVLRPTWEAVSQLLRDDDDGVLSDETRTYLHDCHDHVWQLQEAVEASREAANGLLETYVSAVSLRNNEVMQTLTVIATIFIPLTFITGLYGMNFDGSASPLNMPELRWYWGYPFALGLMAAISVIIFVYVARRGWLGRRPPGPRRGSGGTEGRTSAPQPRDPR